jgi:nuclear pore complex protein Nup155
MPSPASTARAAGGHHHAPARGLEVVAACYASGALLLAEAPRGEARTRLFLLSKDLTTPPVGTATGAHVAVAGLRESVAELDVSVPGEACAIVAVPPSSTSALQTTSSSPETFARGDATSINVAPAPRFAIVTTAGVLEVERLRPADVLAQLLQENDASKLEVFFKAYGAAEAAAMCIQLAAAGPPAAPAAVVAQAKEALDNPRLVGEPEVRDGGSGIDPGTNGTSAGPMEEPALQLGGFDMGAVVPVAEPEWSGAHKGLCLYVARLLQPAWDETVVAPMRSTQDLLRCALPTDALASLEARLRALDSFLRDFLSRKKLKRRHAGPRDPGQPATKRQRLEDAARLELRRTETMAALVARAADACFLLRALVEHNLSRLAARMDRSARAQLRGLRFRDWVSGEDGEAVASNLIAVLVSEHLGAAAGLADDLAAALQSGCPSFFREADRIYYNASGLLRRAETTTTSADRRALLRDAVALLCRAPLAAELGQVIPRLALLRALDAVVELATRKAAAMDPANVAAGAAADGELLPEAEVARARREEACYAHVAAVLRVLSSPTIAAPAPLEAFQKSVTADERPLLRQELLRGVAASKDVLLQECIYAALVEVGLIKELLAIDTPALEPYLVKSSGLGGAMTGAAVGPLSASQVARGEALARLYISRGDYDSAAGVYELLASRVGAPAETPDPPLERRIADLQSAVLQARSCGDAALVDRLEAKAGLAQLQSRMVDSLTAALERCGASNDEWSAGSGMELTREHAEAAVADMKRSLLTMEELYNDVARPAHAWADCLELLHLSGYSDPAYVRQLWDLFLKAAWQRGWDQAGGGDIERCGAGLRTAADAAAALGERFYPSEAAFPVSAVLMRLEQAAAGEWPVRAARLQLDSGVAQRAILSACNGSYDAVVRAYESLLSVRSGDPLAEVLHMPAFRLRLLKSLRDIVLSGKDRVKEREYVGAGSAMVRRELGVLAAACEAYGPEARRLPQDEGEELADEFVAIQEELQALMRHRAGSSFI